VPEARPESPGETKRYAELGLTIVLPSGWVEGSAPADAGAGAKLWRRTESDLPAVVCVGVPAKAYDALRKKYAQQGRDPLDEAARQLRDAATGATLSAPPGAAPADSKITAQPWAHPTIVRGKVMRVPTLDPKAEEGAKVRYVDCYVGEAAGGGLYLFTVAAKSEAELNDLKKLIAGTTLSGMPDLPSTALGAALGREPDKAGHGLPRH
jgi:hypothetical protein